MTQSSSVGDLELWGRTHPFSRLLVMIALVVALVRIAQAGGPKYVAGASYFNSGTMGMPLTWDGGVISYYTDQADLSSIFPGPSGCVGGRFFQPVDLNFNRCDSGGSRWAIGGRCQCC